jgi:hypothetical protein
VFLLLIVFFLASSAHPAAQRPLKAIVGGQSIPLINARYANPPGCVVLNFSEDIFPPSYTPKLMADRRAPDNIWLNLRLP